MAVTKRELYAALRQPEVGMKPFTKVAGNNYLNLAQTLTGSAKSKVVKRGGMEYAIASLEPVQDRMDEEIQKAYHRAQGVLDNIRTAVFSFGDLRNNWVNITHVGGRTDRTLILTDSKNGRQGAMSIEYGRSKYKVKTKSGDTAVVGAMTGKFILHQGFNVEHGRLKGTGGGDV